MSKRWLGCLVVCVVLLMAATAMAVPPNPYHVLHKEGAVYDPNSGWNMSTPPWYPGNDWAVDFLYRPGGPFAILHKDGAIYDSEYGWNLTSSYYPGTNYARAFEHVTELSGCWCSSDAAWNLTKTAAPQHHAEGYPNAYISITQDNRMITVHHCSWNGAAYECGDDSGNVFGNQIVLTAGSLGGPNSCSWTENLAGQYYWDYAADCYGIVLSRVRSDYYCAGTSLGQEEGEYGVVSMKQKYYTGSAWVPCQCPPPRD